MTADPSTCPSTTRTRHERPLRHRRPAIRDLGWLGALPVGLHVENGTSRWLPQRKSTVPTGYTGHGGRWPDDNTIRQWLKVAGHCNVGLRIPDGFIGLDIDQYGDKRRLDNLRILKDTHDLGPLALTKTLRSTSRGPGQLSAIDRYRVPEGHRWKGDSVDGVELIQYGHRYGVVWPSIHPTGAEYRWYVNSAVTDPPSVDDIRFLWLPDPWVKTLTVPDEIPADHPPADEHRETDWSDRVRDVYEAAVTALNDGAVSDHVTTRAKVVRLLRLEQDGHTGATTALDTLEERFVAAVTDPTRSGDVRCRAVAPHQRTSSRRPRPRRRDVRQRQTGRTIRRPADGCADHAAA
jgi:Bifunctional DNA primase/polymerase, N-terminal